MILIALGALYVLGAISTFLSGTVMILSSISSAMFFTLLQRYFCSLLLLQVCLLGCVVNLLAVLCITQAGTLLFIFTAFMSLFFFPKGLWLDMVLLPSDAYLPLLGLNLLK